MNTVNSEVPSLVLVGAQVSAATSPEAHRVFLESGRSQVGSLLQQGFGVAVCIFKNVALPAVPNSTSFLTV